LLARSVNRDKKRHRRDNADAKHDEGGKRQSQPFQGSCRVQANVQLFCADPRDTYSIGQPAANLAGLCDAFKAA